MNYFKRKRIAIMRLVEGVKGFVRTISGIPPITLPDCVDNDSLINYSISGNSVQNGEPTPKNPVEVESVGELTTTIDVFTKKNATIGYLNNLGIEINVGTHKNLYFTDYIKIPKEAQYITQSYIKNSSNTGESDDMNAPSLCFYDNNKIFISGQSFANNNPVTFVIPSNASYFRTCYRAYYTDVQVGCGPYIKYKIPIKMSGKNLFNISNFIQGANTAENIAVKIRVSENGELSFGSRYAIAGGAGIAIPLEAGETICISWERVSGDYYGEFIYGADLKSDGIYTKYEYGQNTVKNATSMKITQKEGYNYINFSIANISARYDSKIKNLLIEKSNTKSGYEPYIEPITTNIYLDEPLNNSDYIDFEKQKIVRNIKMIKLTKAIHFYTWQGRLGVDFGNLLDDSYNRIKGLCNREKRWSANGGEITTLWLGIASKTVRWIGILDYLGFTTLEEMNEWLANNPTYVLYASKSSTETSITLPKLPTIKGTTIYSIETTVQPSNMSAEYYSTSKGE